MNAPTPEQQSQPDGKNQLVFQFSKSKPQGNTSWLNGNRIAVGIGVAGNIYAWKDGKKNENFLKEISSYVGWYANLVDIYFSDKIPPILGELSITRGDWKFENGDMTSSIKGKLPKRAESEIERQIKDAALPKDALRAEYDKKTDTTTFKIADDLFPILEEELEKDLELRQGAINLIKDDSRLLKEQNGKLSTSIGLRGVSKSQITILQNLLDFDFDIKTNLIYKEHQTVLEISADDVDKFIEMRDKNHSKKIDHFKVKSSVDETYAPGFVETLFRPDLHPKQHGILVGALGVNLLRTAAGAIEDKAEGIKEGKRKDPYDSAAGVVQSFSYLIDYMPEVKNKNNRVFVSNELQVSPTASKAKEIQQILDERPLLTSMAVKIPATAMKMKSGLNAIQDGKGNFKLNQAILNGVRALVNSTLQKGDYGRVE